MTSTDRHAMRIGILLCDHIDPDLRGPLGDYADRYRRLLGPLGAEAVLHDLTAGPAPPSPVECDGWLVGGSRRSALEHDPFTTDLLGFCRSAAERGVPLMGVCFGHQVIARALGGTVERAERWSMGVRHYDICAAAPWMPDPPERVALVASHHDHVTVLPDGAEILASTEHCPVAGYRIGDRVFGLQPHPEFDPELAVALAIRRRATVGEATVRAAIASRGTAPDNGLAAEWIQRFLTGDRSRAGGRGEATDGTHRERGGGPDTTDAPP